MTSLGRGDRVAVQLPNWNEFIVTYVALARIGAVLVPTMPIYRHDEVRYVLQHSGAKAAVVAGQFRGFDYQDMLADIRDSAPGLAHVISVRCDPRPGVLRFEDLPLGSPGTRRAVVRWSDGTASETMTWYGDEILICEGDHGNSRLMVLAC